MIMCCKAVGNYASRHAELARKLAAQEANTQRKGELERIAEACEWVPANPARSFYEALQSWWFIHLILYLEKSQRAEQTADFEKWDELLHQTIARATDNSLLISLFMVIHRVRQSDIWGSLKEASLTSERKKIYSQQHHELVKALKERDAGKAERAMREHLEAIKSHLLSAF